MPVAPLRSASIASEFRFIVDTWTPIPAQILSTSRQSSVCLDARFDYGEYEIPFRAVYCRVNRYHATRNKRSYLSEFSITWNIYIFEYIFGLLLGFG